MNKFFIQILTLIIGLIISLGSQSEEPNYQTNPPPMALKYFIALEGEWIGIHIDHEGNEGKVDLVYRTVAGGTAVEERIFANTEKEMVTMYHGDKDGLLMTHYCMLGNQPRLQLKNTHENTFKFVYLDGTGIDRGTTGHMGGMEMKILDENTFEQAWAYYENGNKLNTTKFTFTRK
ncbi:MAG: hypothetical protein AAF304_03945 [Pseudomonadota bacterium]